jgi:ribokinase
MSRVVVFGSVNMDVVAFAPRHPVIGETIKGSELHLLPGGKGANQAVAAKRAGASTSLAARLGEDAFASELRSFLEQEQIDLDLTTAVPAVNTGTALITVASADNIIVIVPGANARLDHSAVAAATFDAGDIVVAQFETPQSTTLAAFEKAKSAGARTVLNPAPAEDVTDGLLAMTDVLVVNETELAILAGRGELFSDGAVDVDTVGSLVAELDTTDGQVVIVTLGAAGAVVFDSTATQIPGRSVSAIDTTGAGDCFVGNLAASLAAGRSMLDSAVRANVAASLCVQVIGAGVSMPTADMVDEATPTKV